MSLITRLRERGANARFGRAIDVLLERTFVIRDFGCDLVISLSLLCGWMIRDARKNGRAALPYVLLTVATGSIGPLLYLIRGSKSAA